MAWAEHLHLKTKAVIGLIYSRGSNAAVGLNGFRFLFLKRKQCVLQFNPNCTICTFATLTGLLKPFYPLPLIGNSAYLT